MGNVNNTGTCGATADAAGAVTRSGAMTKSLASSLALEGYAAGVARVSRTCDPAAAMLTE